MVPLIESLVGQLKQNEKKEEETELTLLQRKSEEESTPQPDNESSIEILESEPVEAAVQEPSEEKTDVIPSSPFEKAILLGVAYSCSIGGMATLVGSGTQLVLINNMRVFFKKEISFFAWFLFASPLSALLVVLLWVYFAFVYLRKSTPPPFQLEQVREEHQKLGKMKYEQIILMVCFCAMVLLWFFRAEMGEFPGWADLFGGPKMVGDGTVACFFAFVLFFLPTFSNHNQKDLADGPAKRIMEWPLLKNLNWGILLLLGSGFFSFLSFHIFLQLKIFLPKDLLSPMLQ